VESVVFSSSTSAAKPILATKNEPASKKTSRKRKLITSQEVEAELENATLPETWDRPLQSCGSYAVVVFVDRNSMVASLKSASRAAKQGVTIDLGEAIEDQIPPLGLKRYQTHHALRYPSREELLSSVESYMSAYAQMEQTRSREEAKKRQKPDEDGFVTVTRGARGGVVRTADAKELGEKLKKKREEDGAGLENFYRFQMRERRKEQQGEMMRKFEEDKRRIGEMRKRRGRLVVSLVFFCPFLPRSLSCSRCVIRDEVLTQVPQPE
jgi:ribosomal RNA-processing protein 7